MARRNNSGRLGVPDTPSDSNPPIPAVDEDTESLFSFVTPTEFVDLPSNGSYAEGHPLCGVGSIEIRHMTAKEEDILSSESLLKKGIALDRLLQSVIIDKRVNVDDLLVGDKNAILIATRITGFGSVYESTVTCPSCFTAAAHHINLDNLETKEVELPPDVTLRDDGTYDVFFSDHNLTVTVRLLRGRDEKRVGQQRDKRKKLKIPDANITDQLRAIIVAVEGHTDLETISHFVDVMPTTLSRQLRASYDAIVPNLDLSVEYECTTCDYEGRVGLPMTADFFWPGA